MTHDHLNWDSPVQYARKVGPKRAEALTAEGVATVGDLLLVPPFRYEDRSRFRRIADLQEDLFACVLGRVIASEARVTPRSGVRLFHMVVRDDSGTLNVVFFNQPYLKDTLKDGQTLVLYGKAERDTYSRSMRYTMKNPAWEAMDPEEDSDHVHLGRIVPIYRKIGILTGKNLREINYLALQSLSGCPDPLPGELKARYRFPDRIDALRQLHFPPSTTSSDDEAARTLSALNEGATTAHRRMVYEEFFLLQAGLRYLYGQHKKTRKPHGVTVTDAMRAIVRRALPFHPTDAQKRAIAEIVADMRQPCPMHRLLQGDVGSGKTIVAVQAAIIAVENGLQVAVMAPTEILAEQHYQSFSALLAHTGYRITLLKRTLTGSEKAAAVQSIASGETAVVVGTHSVIQQDVRFRRLGLAIIDEQHRFGVLQRAELRDKGDNPDILVMTATPIPRTLALTVYGDLALSVIDELPPGRVPVQTSLLKGEREAARGYALIRKELAAGHQAYVVYPLIEESAKLDLADATRGFEEISREIFPDVPVGLLHGSLPESEKTSVMQDFVEGRLKILVSTTVIEVGIDVPKATVMMIQHAERFGLGQLHQLRGRVGRAGDQSYCLLVAYGRPTEESGRRLKIMVETTDGFRIAEEDLAIRGPGEFAGTRQSGLLSFRFGSLVAHGKIMEQARADAEAYVGQAEENPQGEGMRYLNALKPLWQRRYGLATIG